MNLEEKDIINYIHMKQIIVKMILLFFMLFYMSTCLFYVSTWMLFNIE